MKNLLLITLLAMAATAHAGVYKCQDAKGRTVYQETPCESASLKAVGTVKKPADVPEEERARMLEVQQKTKADSAAASDARKKAEKVEEEKRAAAYQRHLEERKAAATERQATAAEDAARAAEERNRQLMWRR